MSTIIYFVTLCFAAVDLESPRGSVTSPELPSSFLPRPSSVTSSGSPSTAHAVTRSTRPLISAVGVAPSWPVRGGYMAELDQALGVGSVVDDEEHCEPVEHSV
jgi:hypothetical protein